MKSSMSLANKLYLVLISTGLLILVATISFFYVDEQVLAEKLVKESVDSTAQNYFDTINTMMLTGTMANRDVYNKKLVSQGNIVEARIIRAPTVKKLYGDGLPNQKAQDDLDQLGLQGKKEFRIIERNGSRQMHLVMPVFAEENYRGTNCLGCHQAQKGDLLGVVRVAYDLEHVDDQIFNSVASASLLQIVIIIAGFGGLSFAISKLVLFRLTRLKNTLTEIEQNLDLSKDITVYYDDELGAVSKALNKMIDKFRTSLKTVSDATSQLIASAKDVDEIAELTKEAVLIQKNGTDSVAAAINELDVSATEVENNTKYAADKSIEADRKASEGRALATASRQGIEHLCTQVEENSHNINQLNERINEVGTVLDVITAIAEQTNLLALNAAIEAARAGEQGRGFAVVADEVRSLATRTRESIDQIHSTISGLQSDARNAVDTMNQVSKLATEKAQDVNAVSELLTEISSQISELDELNCQIASAAKQQNLAADEINVNVVNISDIAEQSSDDAIRGKQISENLLSLSMELEKQVKQFKLA